MRPNPMSGSIAALFQRLTQGVHVVGVAHGLLLESLAWFECQVVGEHPAERLSCRGASGSGAELSLPLRARTKDGRTARSLARNSTYLRMT